MKVYLVHDYYGYSGVVYGIYTTYDLAKQKLLELAVKRLPDFDAHRENIIKGFFPKMTERNLFIWATTEQDKLNVIVNVWMKERIDEVELDTDVDIVVYME